MAIPWFLETRASFCGGTSRISGNGFGVVIQTQAIYRAPIAVRHPNDIIPSPTRRFGYDEGEPSGRTMAAW
jgi:hypothetical protein